MAQSTKIFSKLLTVTDIKKRMAIPKKILPSLPDMKGRHAVKIHLMHGTKTWPIVYSIRKKGYKKPVFSGPGWRKFVIYNNFNVGDELTLYNLQDEAGSFHYRVQVEKPARPSGDLSPRSFSLSHEVDETTGKSHTKACNSQYEQEQLLEVNATIEQEEAITELVDDAADEPVPFVDHIIAKPPIRIFGTNVSDDTTSKAHFKTKQEGKMNFFGITKSICMDEPLNHSYSMTNEEREIKFFGLAEDGAMAFGTSCQAVGDTNYCEIRTERLGFDLNRRPHTPNEEREIKFFGLAEDGAMAYGTSQAVGETCYMRSKEMLRFDLNKRPPTP